MIMAQAEVAHDGAEVIEMLCSRVGELETALKALIDECLMQDSRNPRPALQQADAALWMRRQRTAGKAADNETLVQAGRLAEEMRAGAGPAWTNRAVGNGSVVSERAVVA